MIDYTNDNGGKMPKRGEATFAPLLPMQVFINSPIPLPSDLALTVVGRHNQSYRCQYAHGFLLLEPQHVRSVVGMQAVLCTAKSVKASDRVADWFRSYGVKVGVRYNMKSGEYEIVTAHRTAHAALLLDGLEVDRRNGDIYPKPKRALYPTQAGQMARMRE